MKNSEFSPPDANRIPQEEQAKRYLKRKAMSRFTDAQLLADHGGSYNFGDKGAEIIEGDIHTYREVIGPRLTGRRVINIGSGRDAFETALSIFGSLDSDGNKNRVDMSSIPSEYVGVDLFLDADRANLHGKQMIRQRLESTIGISENEKTNLIERINQVQADGLGYLLSQPDHSGNVLFASIDGFLIQNGFYLMRLAQEAFRVTGDRDIVACMNSPEIAREAKELFPYSVTIRETTFFSKEPFPSEETKD